jgi:hypothetical protein
LVLAACGGGESGTPATAPAPSSPTVVGSNALAQQCAPNNDHAPGPRTGSLDVECRWLRAYMDEAYLWHDQIPQVDADSPLYNTGSAAYSLNQCFNALLVRPQDRFSTALPTSQFQALMQAGTPPGYGIEWLQGASSPPRNIRIAYVHAGSPAANAGLQRGDQLLWVDDVSVDVAENDPGNGQRQQAMFPLGTGQQHDFVFARSGGGALQTTLQVTLQAGPVALVPVPLVRTYQAANGARVGYLVFHDHIAPAEAALIDALRALQAQGVTELVLDLRYNGGGYNELASQLGYMIAGPARTAGRLFERYVYSDKRPSDTDNPASQLAFLRTTCQPDAQWRCQSADPLPTLDLPRVHVITRASTCTASEALLNGLRGVGVAVHQIGSTTCGKPYGGAPKNNCGISYLPVEFTATNDRGEGHYAEGFSPVGTGPHALQGCQVNDDLDHALGDASEAMLSTALAYIGAGAQCPGLSAPMSSRSRASPLATSLTPPADTSGVLLPSSPLRQSRLVMSPQR